MGHEGVGIVEEVGAGVRNFRPGDRVVIPSTIACGTCGQCHSGHFAQCDRANPNGPESGTCFFGGPKSTGPLNGLQAEYARVPYAHFNLVRIPENVSDDQAILVSDIFPTGFFGAEMAHISHGDVVAVFGCGPVGQFAIASAFFMGAGRVLAVDHLEDRLDTARQLGAEPINFENEDPVETIKELTGGMGVERCIDAVGVDAERPEKGPAAPAAEKNAAQFETERNEVGTEQTRWTRPEAPSQALRWAVEGVKKSGTLSVVGVYPPTFQHFPFGAAMGKNLHLHAGNCNHRKYIPKLLAMVSNNTVHLDFILSKKQPLLSALDAYEQFDKRQSGWLKVELQPAV